MKNNHEFDVAKTFLDASSKDIYRWIDALKSYGEYEFKNKILGDKVRLLRISFWHNGSEQAINNFWKCHADLKKHIRNGRRN